VRVAQVRIAATAPGRSPLATTPSETLLRRATRRRTDLRAARLAFEAAAARAGWQRSRIFEVSAVLDVNIPQETPVGGGIALPIPIFDQNQGAIGRAEAEARHAAFAHIELQRRIAGEVLEARAREASAAAALDRYRTELLPAAERALERAVGAYEAGDQSYQAVLDATLRLETARVSEAELDAELRRARADLDRAVGGSR
jgi:cobalt-zinc-cadmium efflux system outer membrane protein